MIKKILGITLKAFFAFIIAYLFLNVVAIYQYVTFLVKPDLFVDKKLNQTVDEIVSNQSTITNEDKINLKQLPDNYLIYPKLGIKAPVLWDVPEILAMDKLAQGLVHIKNTSKPGLGGEVLITGHSSYYWWQDGNYKNVFASLPKAEVGDKIIVRRGKVYIYSVVNKYQVKGSETLMLNSSGGEVLNLVTCVPLGTNLRRLIVEADLVFDD